MTTFTIDTENNITAFVHPHEADAVIGNAQPFATSEELADLAAGWPAERLIDVCVAGFSARGQGVILPASALRREREPTGRNGGYPSPHGRPLPASQYRRARQPFVSAVRAGSKPAGRT
jgi:hypothetical protein